MSITWSDGVADLERRHGARTADVIDLHDALPSAFTLSMKRSKFFENWVFGEGRHRLERHLLRHRQVGGRGGGERQQRSEHSRRLHDDPLPGAANAAAMTEGYGQTPARATADRARQDAIQAACTACVNSATFFW
jgi:hypothetical protein